MAEKQTNKERLKDITDSIETGIKELFESDRYCRKCKSEYPINLGCFRRMKAKRAVCRLLSGKPRQKR